MVHEKLVSADDLTWPHAYCGEVKLHPNDDSIQLYLDSYKPFTSEPNGEGIELTLVAYKSKSKTAHFRRKDAIPSEYLDIVRKNIHNRMIDVVSKYIKRDGEVALESICKADVSGFKYDECFVEQNIVVGDITYRPDIVVYQKDRSTPRIELEVVFTHDIEHDRSEALSKSGHLLLSINIERWVNNLAQQEIEDVSDNEILAFVKTKKFSHYSKKEKHLAERIWNEMRIIDVAEKFLDKGVFAPCHFHELEHHYGELKWIVSRDYSKSISERAACIISKINPHLSDLRKTMKENERKWREQLERDRKERKEREAPLRKRHEGRREQLYKESQEQLRERRQEYLKGVSATKNNLVLDVETYRNYFLVLFKRVGSDETHWFELYDGCPLNVDKLADFMKSNLTVSFNGNSYDLYMIAAAINGFTNEQLKRLSDDIILSNKPGWMIASKRGCEPPKTAYGKTLWNHIDIINVAPGQASLKIYGGRIAAPKMQDLPIEPDALISPEQREDLRVYCLNDLETTELLYTTLSKQMKLRQDMSKQYRIDLRSKSDAQIAEAVFRKEIGDLEGRQVRPIKNVDMDKTYRYLDPKIIGFEDEQLRSVLEHLIEAEFGLAKSGSIQLPDWLKETKIKIGETEYQMGIGGLHSCEKKRHVVPVVGEILRDADVASYYPSIILQQGLIPENIGKGFVDVYTSIYHRRLEAKNRASELKVKLNTLKQELANAKKVL